MKIELRAPSLRWEATAFLISALCFLLSGLPLRATTFTATSCLQPDVQAAINSANTGDTVVVPSGTCTWSSQVTISKSIAFQGQTSCTGSGDPAYNNLACNDATDVTLGATTTSAPTLQVTVPSGGFVTVSGFTFIATIVDAWNGQINVTGTWPNVAFRIHHCHIKQSAYPGVPIFVNGVYGLIDRVLDDDTNSTMSEVLFASRGDTDNGFLTWNTPEQLGTDQAVIVEQCTQNASVSTNENFTDDYAGARIVVRFNTINNNGAYTTHGYDSNCSRSTMMVDFYGNAFVNNSNPQQFTRSRGGTVLFWNNKASGSGGFESGLLLYYRIYDPSNTCSEGSARAGLNWTPTASKSTTNTLNAPDFVASNPYAANAAVGPLSSNSGKYNFQLTNGPCTSGSYPSSWSQTINTTTTDSNGCIWLNVGGITTTVSGGAGFCAANPDTQCTANSTCAALQSGDTCSRYVDTAGGVYPFRDQPCQGYNQGLFPCYQWGNSGSAVPTIFSTDSSLATVIEANRDWYDYTASFNGTVGVGVGTLANRPSTCTTGVAYFATDQGSWNQSGNGFGQGVLYQCSATNTWTVYYTPYTYPHPLQGGGNTPPPPPPGGGTAASVFSPRAYPNPWRADRGYAPLITFDQLAGNTTIKIFTVSGHLVRTLATGSTLTTWDLTNDSGDRVASGIYIYLVTNDQGQSARGKVVVIR